jgi:hypothetical protein
MYKRIGMVVVLAALIMGSAMPAYAWHGRHGFHGGHGYRRPSVVIVPRVVVPFWAPYPYGYPHVVVSPPPVYVQPAPRVYVQPAPPQQYWYYCDDPPGYYPYVQQCPAGWRQVLPSPQ